MNLKDKFFVWFHGEFVFTSLMEQMTATVEASKWHREDNVGVHTSMVVAEYLKFSPNEWSIDDLCGAFACAFHDVGKPAARTEKYSEERGVYYSYPGHEQISARLWEDWALSNVGTLGHFKLTIDDVYRIGWMIEHHLPYATSKADKVARMVDTVVDLFVDGRVMCNVLLADQFGRISDDMEYNRQKVVDWVDSFKQKCEARMNEKLDNTSRTADKTCYLFIGPSGCGKSTQVALVKERNPSVHHYSWDELRLEWYSPNTGDEKADYQVAFQASTEDKAFQQKSEKAFVKLLDGNAVIVDNTNLTVKRRRFFVEAARKKGYSIVGVVFPITLNELKRRHSARPDKTVPWEVVKGMYMSIQLPSIGEVDTVISASAM